MTFIVPSSSFLLLLASYLQQTHHFGFGIPLVPQVQPGAWRVPALLGGSV